jgi:hypothetical protein
MNAVPVTAQQILVAAQRIPAMGRAFRALEVALNDPNATLTSVMEAVRLDAALATRILRSANSVVYRRGEPCRSLDEAIGRIGLREVERLTGAFVAQRMFSDGLPLYRLGGDQLWVNTIASALAAEHIAGLAGTDPRQAYTLGVLRSVGRLLCQRLALDLSLPPIGGEKLDAGATRAWEVGHFGATAEQLGGRMLRLWEFPAEQESALRHVVAPELHPALSRECAGLHLACWTAENLGKGLPFEEGLWRIDDTLLKQAGVSETAARDTVVSTRDLLNRTLQVMRS